LPSQERNMEFSELFTQSVREVLPLVRDKNLVSYFDYRGPFIDLLDGDAGLRAGIHRILRGIVDCIDTGFVMFSAEVKVARGGCSKVLVHAAGTGVTNLDGIQRVLQRLQLQPVPAADAAAAGGVSSARGACPASGGTATFLDGGPEGLVISLEILVAAVEAQGDGPPPDAAGATAWLVSPMPGGLDQVSHRLRRLGWHVCSFSSLEQAPTLIAAGQDATSAPPMLLIVAESTGLELTDMERIAAAAPSVWTVLAVLAGSPTVQVRGATSVDIRLLPLSPMELERFTAHVDWGTSTAESRETSPGPLYVQDRRLVLVVDDSTVNQLIACGQLEALGYDVAVAGDGVEALDACQRRAPDMVLMDVDMPVMGGLEATVGLRALQEVGTLPPFPIVAATSGHGAVRRNDCLAAGMDGYLSKPLDLRILADELHRVLPTRPVAHENEQAPRTAH
jgi:CheY-like chemotaxis protein